MIKHNNILDLLQSKSYQLAVEELNQACHFPTNVGVKITSIGLDYAEGELTLESSQGEKLDNGLLFTLADEITGIAACSRGISYVTISSNMNFMENIASGKVVCKATPQCTGEDISIFQAVITDETESLLAIGCFVFQIKNRYVVIKSPIPYD